MVAITKEYVEQLVKSHPEWLEESVQYAIEFGYYQCRTNDDRWEEVHSIINQTELGLYTSIYCDGSHYYDADTREIDYDNEEPDGFLFHFGESEYIVDMEFDADIGLANSIMDVILEQEQLEYKNDMLNKFNQFYSKLTNYVKKADQIEDFQYFFEKYLKETGLNKTEYAKNLFRTNIMEYQEQEWSWFLNILWGEYTEKYTKLCHKKMIKRCKRWLRTNKTNNQQEFLLYC